MMLVHLIRLILVLLCLMNFTLLRWRFSYRLSNYFLNQNPQDSPGFHPLSTVQQCTSSVSSHIVLALRFYCAPFPTGFPFLTSDLCTVYLLPLHVHADGSLFVIKLFIKLLTFVLGVKWHILFHWLQQWVLNNDWQDQDEKTEMRVGFCALFHAFAFAYEIPGPCGSLILISNFFF